MTTPPKRNYGPKRGLKKTRPTFRPETAGAQSGLGPAYNSAKDPRGPDAYVPVPVDPTQRKRTPGPGSGYGKRPKVRAARVKAIGPTSAELERRKTGDQWIG